MTEERLVLAELLEKTGEGDFLRAVAEAVLQLLMETDVEGLIGAGRYERSGERTTWRNGYRDRTIETRLGALQLRIPKLRQGSYFPPFLEARTSSEKALIAVIQEAWIGGGSTRRVDDLVQAMGLPGSASRRFPALQGDRRAGARLPRPAPRRRVAVSVARRHRPEAARGRPHRLGCRNNRGRGQHWREIVGLHIGPSEAEAFWSTFLRSLPRRGLRGIKLVISDAHEGLKAAIRRVFGAGWQRCRVHWMRNALAYVSTTQQSMVAAALRQAFLQPDRAQASAMLRHVADQLRQKWPKLAAFIDDSETDVLSYLDFPEPHRSKLHSTDEIDKPFCWFAHVSSCSLFCPSKARWREGCWNAALSTPTAAEGGGRRPAFTKLHCSSDNRPWRSRGCSVQRQIRWTAQPQAPRSPAGVVLSPCTGDRVAKSKSGG
jgi:putative transposase